MTENEASDRLYGPQYQRAKKWERFPIAMRNSAVLYSIAQMHIGGRCSYRTALLIAIDAFNQRALEMNKPQYVASDAWIQEALKDHDVTALEEQVRLMSHLDELTIQEMVRINMERTSLLGVMPEAAELLGLK